MLASIPNHSFFHLLSLKQMAPQVKSYFRYPPTFEQDARWGLCVTGVGHCDVPPDSPFPASCHPTPYAYKWEKGRVLSDYHLLYIVAGKAEFESEASGLINIEAGSVVLSFPGVWHRCRPVSDIGWKNYWVCAHGEQLDRLVSEGLISPLEPVLHTGLNDSIKLPFMELLDCVGKDEIGSAYVLAAKTMEIYAAVLMSIRQQSTDRDKVIESHESSALDSNQARTLKDEMLARAIRLIWENQQPSLTVEELLKQLPVTRRTLERKFRQELGRTILEEINRCHLHRAERLLKETHLPVQTISMRAGFPNTQRMYQVFRRVYGLSPSEYRQKNSGHGK
ncbi:MAG: AraC family transcriptional regulator [Pirellulales bacterium]|nr:AraC family transcriptional regulator [Pirellulales bacterium]